MLKKLKIYLLCKTNKCPNIFEHTHSQIFKTENFSEIFHVEWHQNSQKRMKKEQSTVIFLTNCGRKIIHTDVWSQIIWWENWTGCGFRSLKFSQSRSRVSTHQHSYFFQFSIYPLRKEMSSFNYRSSGSKPLFVFRWNGEQGKRELQKRKRFICPWSVKNFFCLTEKSHSGLNSKQDCVKININEEHQESLLI